MTVLLPSTLEVGHVASSLETASAAERRDGRWGTGNIRRRDERGKAGVLGRRMRHDGSMDGALYGEPPPPGS